MTAVSVCSCTSWTATPQDILSLPTILSSMAVICLWMRQHCCPNPQTIDSRCVYTPFRHSTFCFLPSPILGTGRDPIQQTNHQTPKKLGKRTGKPKSQHLHRPAKRVPLSTFLSASLPPSSRAASSQSISTLDQDQSTTRITTSPLFSLRPLLTP